VAASDIIALNWTRSAFPPDSWSSYPGDYGPALALLPDAGARLFASPILLPGGSITVPGLSTTGVSFTFTGTLTQNDTLALTQTGDPCLQPPPSYCTNGAGVVTVAGTSPVGAATTFTGTFGGTTASWDFGALLLEISGEGTVQIFPANAANGLGSATPVGSRNPKD